MVRKLLILILTLTLHINPVVSQIGLINAYYISAGLDIDAQAFIDSAGITDGTQKTAINTLVIGMKSAGIWPKVKVACPIVGGTAFAHKWNLMDPQDTDEAFRLTFVGAWVHSSDGMIGGSGIYANTHLIANDDLDANSLHLGVYSRTDAGEIYYDIGAYDGSNTSHLFSKWSDDKGYFRAYSGADGVVSADPIPTSQGFISGSRASSTDCRIYYRGTQTGTTNTTPATSSRTTVVYYVGANNNNGTAANFATRQYAYITIGDGLTPTEMSNYNDLIVEFQTTLGREL